MQTVNLDKIQITKELEAVRGEYDPAAFRANDWGRWSYVLDLVRDGSDLLDIGIGGGQFVNAAARVINRVRGIDRKKHSTLVRKGAWEYIPHDLTEPADSIRAQIVTCMECVEHIASPAFEVAIGNLKSMATARLIVTVPYREDPLPAYHFQRFDEERLLGLFPGATISLMASKSIVRWALVDWRP